MKTKTIIYLVIMPLVITGAFYYSLYTVYQYIENRDKQIFIDGFEQGHFAGLNEGYDSAYDEFYDKLSTNPQVSYLFKKYFPNQEEARIMRAISLAESRGNQTAVNKANKNGSHDYGFFQINTIHRKKGETIAQFNARMNNLSENFAMAREILDRQGYTSWATYNNKEYLKYLK